MKISVGLFGIGLDTYWPQFDGLLTNLMNYQESIKKNMEGFEVEVVDAGMVDNPSKAVQAAQLLNLCFIVYRFTYSSKSKGTHNIVKSAAGCPARL